MNKMLLTQQQETDLCDRWQKNKDKAARDKMVLANMGLVGTMVKQYIHSNSSLYNYDDLTQECVFALVKSIDRFNVKSGLRFSTYASWWIRVSIQNYIVANSSALMIKATSKTTQMLFRRKKMMAAFTDANGNIDVVKAAKKAGIAADTVVAFDNSQARVSLNMVKNEDGEEQISLIPSTDMSADEVVEKSDVSKQVNSLLNKLNEKEKEVITGLFFMDKRQVDISREKNVSRQRIEQLKNNAMKKMREQLMAA